VILRFHYVGGGVGACKVGDAREAERMLTDAAGGNGFLRIDDTQTSSVRLINLANVTCVAVDEDG
jgi:hypothetical protein